MTVRLLLCLFTVLLFGASCAHASGTFLLYPYDPMNAVAADPDPPYNFDSMPKYSRTMVIPCPSCGPASGVVPDLQPMQEAYRAKQGRRVPVP